jgi:putative nucleotidyltransferase with HDIG domain
MPGKTGRVRRWIDELILELTTDSDKSKAPNPVRPAATLLPPASSHSSISRQESLVKPVTVVRNPSRKRMPLVADDFRTRQAAKAVDRSKKAVVHVFEDVRLGRSIEVSRLTPIVALLSKEVEQNANALLEVLRLKNKSEYTYLHSVAVSTMMLLLARAMGYAGNELSELGLAGLLHDIGKMGVPSRILDKPDRLTDIEFASIRSHPTLGHELLLNVPNLPEVARNVCLFHHEKIDGSGYPFGRTKNEISVAARMGAICDVYNALTWDRAYNTPSWRG